MSAEALVSAEKRNLPCLRRDKRQLGRLGEFIMDDVQKSVKVECQRQLGIIERRLKGAQFARSRYKPDEDLMKPWETFLAQSKDADDTEWDSQAERELAQSLQQKQHDRAVAEITAHVERVRREWSAQIDLKFTARDITRRQDILRRLSKEFASGPKTLRRVTLDVGQCGGGFTVEQLKASYAYVHDYTVQREKSEPWKRFPWDVAFRALGEIKSKALGPTKTVPSDWYSSFTIKSSFVRRD